MRSTIIFFLKALQTQGFFFQKKALTLSPSKVNVTQVVAGSIAPAMKPG